MPNTDPLEHLREQLLAAVYAFDSKLNAEIDAYRKQRAWRIMLYFRKAYTLMSRGGWSGPWRVLWWTIRGFIGGSLELHTAELTFPNLSSHLPEELFYPLAEGFGKRTYSEGGNLQERQYDVLIFPVFDYEFRFQRPQQIAVEFARRGHRVFWVSPSRVVKDGAKFYEVLPLRENLWELQLRIRPQDLYKGTLGEDDLSSMLASLEQFYRDFAVGTSCVLAQFPYWRQCVLGLRTRFGATVIYDCMDDWQNWSAEPAISAFSRGEESKLARECDLLLVTSGALEARHKSAGCSPVLVRNAADFRFFNSGVSRGLLASLHRPVIGYYGAIADWFDLEMVCQVARARPTYSFVLIGHNYRNDINRLGELPNVFLLGEKQYRELPSYLQEFDVCLLPFSLSELVKTVDPVKVYEYLSQGKALVATPLPELEYLGELLYFAKTADEFATQIDAALNESDSAVRGERVKFAAHNTWSHRIDDAADAIQARYPLVSILIVTYNCREFLRLCLDSIRRNTAYPNYEVVVVDNNSSDGTPDVLRECAAGNPRILPHYLDENRGFAAGNNEAARQSRGDYLLLLNPDTIVTFGWLHRLLRALRGHAEAGMAVPVTNFSGNETKINFQYSDMASMEEFARSIATTQMEARTEIHMAPLLCGLVSRAHWTSLGGLDETFGAGMFEDDDFSVRLRHAGLRVIVAEDCFIHHFGNGSFAQIPSDLSLQIFNQNRRRFEQKWGKPWTEHRLRPGVRSIQEDRRFTPEDFRTVADIPGGRRLAPVLRSLFPSTASAGAGFNVQPEGDSAIDITCLRATPGTVVVFAGIALRTVYASPSRVTALVPQELLAKRGKFRLCLQNDYGESSQFEFVVS